MKLRLSNSASIVVHCDYIQVLENVSRIGMEMFTKTNVDSAYIDVVAKAATQDANTFLMQ